MDNLPNSGLYSLHGEGGSQRRKLKKFERVSKIDKNNITNEKTHDSRAVGVVVVVVVVQESEMLVTEDDAEHVTKQFGT